MWTFLPSPHSLMIIVLVHNIMIYHVGHLQKRDGHWREVMVDVDYSPNAEHHLRFVLSQQSTTTGKLLLQVGCQPLRESSSLCMYSFVQCSLH